MRLRIINWRCRQCPIPICNSRIWLLVGSAFSLFLICVKWHKLDSINMVTYEPEFYRYGRDILLITEEMNATFKYYPDNKAHDYPLTVLPEPYIISNEEVCTNMPELKFIVIVISSAKNFEQRNIIRQTWGNVSYYRSSEVKIVFILGRPQLEMYQKIIERENRIHQDIVQGKFLEGYRNLTHKSVLGIRWVNEHCLNSKMVIKVDDDIVVNLFELFNMMESGECCKNPDEIKCHRREHGASQIYRKHYDSKWIIDDDYFPQLRIYPFTYCDGFFSLIPQKVIPILYETATRMPYFWIEDVYLTGILVSYSAHIQLADLAGVSPKKLEVLECFGIMKENCTFVAGSTHNSNEFHYLWSLVLEYR